MTSPGFVKRRERTPVTGSSSRYATCRRPADPGCYCSFDHGFVRRLGQDDAVVFATSPSSFNKMEYYFFSECKGIFGLYINLTTVLLLQIRVVVDSRTPPLGPIPKLLVLTIGEGANAQRYDSLWIYLDEILSKPAFSLCVPSCVKRNSAPKFLAGGVLFYHVSVIRSVFVSCQNIPKSFPGGRV